MTGEEGKGGMTTIGRCDTPGFEDGERGQKPRNARSGKGKNNGFPPEIYGEGVP